MTDHKEWEREMSSEFSGMMDGLRTESMPQESLARSLQAAESIAMTAAAMKRGRKNAFIVALLMYPVVGLIAWWISHKFDASLTIAVGGVFCGLFVAMLPFVYRTSLVGRARAGRVLLDCGPHPGRKLFRLMAVLMLAGAVGTLIVSRETVAVLFACFLAACTVYWLFMASGRLLFCDNGVFQYHSLLSWDRIESYRWEGETDATLMLQKKGRVAFLNRGALPVAVEQKDAVEALLKEHLR